MRHPHDISHLNLSDEEKISQLKGMIDEALADPRRYSLAEFDAHFDNLQQKLIKAGFTKEHERVSA